MFQNMVKVQNLLPNTSRYINLTGEKFIAGGYECSLSSGLHTLTIATGMKGCVGRVYLQGTLELEPTDKDWFYIPFNKNSIFVEFPIRKDPQDNNSDIISEGKVYSYEFESLPIYVRAIIDRTYIENWGKMDPSEFGDFRYINISF